MKRFIALFIVLSIFAYSIGVTAAEEEYTYDIKDNILYSADGESFVEYLPEFDAFYIHNVSPDKVDDAMSRSDEICLVSNETIPDYSLEESVSTFVNDKFTELNGAEFLASTTTRKTYTLSTSIRGLYNDTVYIDYLVNMNVTTLTYNGDVYDLFVSVCSPESSNISAGLRNSSYTTAAGWRQPSAVVVDSGVRLRVDHIIQVERTVMTNVGSVGEGWSLVIGSSFTYRTGIVSKTFYKKLPIYNVLY